MNLTRTSLGFVKQIAPITYKLGFHHQCFDSFGTNTSHVCSIHFQKRNHSHDSKSSDITRSKARKRIDEVEQKMKLTPNSPIGIVQRSPGVDPNAQSDILVSPTVDTNETYKAFPGKRNPVTGELDGPTGPEPTRFGDWERKGRCSDF